jgi:hypothetical protein
VGAIRASIPTCEVPATLRFPGRLYCRGVDEVVEAVLITGPPGSGKTAIAKEMSESLWRSSEPHAVIELDELCCGVLPAATADFNHQLAVDNLRAVWANFAALGVRRLVLTRIVQTDNEIDRYAQAVPGIKLSICPRRTQRHAPPETRSLTTGRHRANPRRIPAISGVDLCVDPVHGSVRKFV